MSNPIPEVPQKSSKNLIILTSSIITISLLAVIAGMTVYQSMKTTDASKPANSSSMSSISSESKMNSSISNPTEASTSNLTKFTDAQLPGFSFSYPAQWKVESNTPFGEGNGSGGPSGEFFTKKIVLKSDSASIDIDINTVGVSGIGLPSCFTKDSTVVTGQKYTVISNKNGTNVIELNQNLAKSTDVDFAKYFAASGETVSNPNAKISDYSVCVKSSTVFPTIKTNVKKSDGNFIREGFINLSSSVATAEIVSIMDSIEGITQ